jgi:hypothetical protein
VSGQAVRVLYCIYRLNVGIRGNGVRCVSHGQVYLTLVGWLAGEGLKSLSLGAKWWLSPVLRRNQDQRTRLCKIDN